MDVFQYKSYKDYLKQKITQNAHLKGYRAALAKAAGCQPSFLSQALNSHVHLTLDHGAGLCAFWQFDDARADYYLDLMGWERAASPTLKRRLATRLTSQREASKQLRKRSTAASEAVTAGLKEAVYYSSWHYAAIHALTAIPTYQAVAAITQRLALPSSLVERALNDLASIGVVEATGGRWRVKGPSVHLPKESPLSTINQSNWRARAVRHLGEQEGAGIHYSGLFALSLVDAEKVQRLMQDALDAAVKIAERSEDEEELVCVNLDFFPVLG